MYEKEIVRVLVSLQGCQYEYGKIGCHPAIFQDLTKLFSKMCTHKEISQFTLNCSSIKEDDEHLIMRRFPLFENLLTSDCCNSHHHPL